MENEEQHESTSAESGSSSGNTGTSDKTVPESDLIALKQSLESKVATATKQAEEAETAKNAALVTLETERAGHKPVEAKAGQVDALTQEVSELKMSSALEKEEHDKLKGDNLKAIKAQLVTVYKLPQDKVDSMTIEQAQMFLSTLPTPPHVSSMAHLGLLNGQNEGGENLRPVDRMRRAFDADK